MRSIWTAQTSAKNRPSQSLNLCPFRSTYSSAGCLFNSEDFASFGALEIEGKPQLEAPYNFAGINHFESVIVDLVEPATVG